MNQLQPIIRRYRRPLIVEVAAPLAKAEMQTAETVKPDEKPKAAIEETSDDQTASSGDAGPAV